MFIANAGARKIYAIENSNIVIQTQQIIIDNKLDNIITIIQDDILNLKSLRCIVVDIIIFDWRGKSVLNEYMLKSIIHARNYFLRNDGFGIIFPNILKLYLCAMENQSIIKNKVNINIIINIYFFNLLD
jgi:hypothetical protein